MILFISDDLHNRRLPCFFGFQLRIRASDQGQCSTDGSLIVNIERNEYGPQFIPNNVYETTIFETHNLVEPVYTVSATDQDTQAPFNVIRFSLAPNSANSNMFFINTLGGQVYLRTSVFGNDVDRYTVSWYHNC